MTAQERPAGRPTSSARPAGALTNRRSGPAELHRLIALGVNPDAAAVLAAVTVAQVLEERAYWRQMSYGHRATHAQCAAHAVAQRARRHDPSRTDKTRRSA